MPDADVPRESGRSNELEEYIELEENNDLKEGNDLKEPVSDELAEYIILLKSVSSPAANPKAVRYISHHLTQRLALGPSP